MKTKSIIAIALVLLQGCATMSDSNRTRGESAGLGALIGAGIGALVSDNSAQGALIGGIIGGLAGLVYGDHVAKKKERFASQEDYLDACIAAAAQRYEEAVAFNRTTRTEVASMEQELETLTAQVEQSRDEQRRLKRVQQDLNKRMKESKTMLASVNDEILIQREVYQSESEVSDLAQLEKLEAQIAMLEEQKTELEITTNQLAGLNNRFAA